MTLPNETKLYKVLGPDGEPIHGGTGVWYLPKNGNPGEWMPPTAGTIVVCMNG